MTETLPLLECRGVPVVDTFAGAFPMTGLRRVVTAASERRTRIAAESCGPPTRVIACDRETAVERGLAADEPSGREGREAAGRRRGR